MLRMIRPAHGMRWPGGLTERFDNLSVDQINTAKEGSGIAVKNEPPKKP